MMRILPRKAFRFEAGLRKYRCVPGKIQDVDERFAKCLMFKLGLQSGDIQVITTPEQLRAAENDPDEGKPKTEPKGKAKGDGKGKPKAETPEDGDAE